MENFAINSVLDQAREAHGLKSDYQLCKAFGLAPNSVSHWRHGRALPDEKACRVLADAAGIDPLVLAAQVQAQRSKTAEARSMWEQIAERLALAAHGATAAFFAVAIAIGLIAADAGPASASESQAFNLTAGSFIHRI
ncbi:DUF3693 domain-containing protein [Diaphorobacter nitroreducens]|uniref:DUF3693 domain-containing protein n=1 Tax=Diaphorobacter nitroreducens TaxID=164759 RepID=UPI0028A2B674|nr:DUF3693 domain-containing protein [Diaphorobacter nitroreducens]